MHLILDKYYTKYYYIMHHLYSFHNFIYLLCVAIKVTQCLELLSLNYICTYRLSFFTG